MRIARRYIALEIYRSSAMVLFALVALFSFFNLVDNLDRISKGISLRSLLYLEMLNIPTQLYELLPIGLLIGSVLALSGLAQRNELVTLRVAGVSGMKLLFTLWLITTPLMFAAAGLSEYVVPRTEIQVNEGYLKVYGRTTGSRLNSGYWFKENNHQATNTKQTRIINIGELIDTTSIKNIALYEFDEDQHLQAYIEAEKGYFNEGQLHLDDAQKVTISPSSLQALDDNNQLLNRNTSRPHVQHNTQTTLAIDTSLTAERLIARVLTPERMAIRDLLDYLDYLQANQLQTDRQVVAIWRKVAYPFSLLVMITIAAPITFIQTRQGGVGSKMFIGILTGVGFFMLNQLALNLGMLSHWRPWVTALLPNLLALLVALAVLYFIENPKHRLKN